MRSFFHRITILCALLLLVALPLFFAGCGEKTTSRTIFAMDTVMSLRVEGSEADLDALQDVVFSLERELSTTDPKSAVSRLNETGESTFSSDGIALLKRAIALSAQTDGAFDVTVFPLVRKWGFTTGAYAVPTDEELAALLPLVSSSYITIEGSTVRVRENVRIDLGGIAKGYLGDSLRSLCLSRGIDRAIFNLGGNVVAVGNKKDGSPWKVAISDPDESGYIGTLSVTDRSVVTSGAYERYFERDGVRYGHILDPKTGRPANGGLTSVTVIGENGVDCDALGTALFVMGTEKAKAFCLANDLQAVLLDENGTVWISETLFSSFTPDARFTVEVIG